jgi:endonuclease-3
MHKFEKLLEILVRKLNKNASAENLSTGENKVFRVLIASILSTRTRDETTEEVCKKFFRVIRNFNDLDKISINKLEKLIYPVGFYKTKARILKKLAKRLKNKEVPGTMEELLQLPGVGRKVANLVLSVGFDKQALAVDTHVHRICNRFEYVNTGVPEETEIKLKEKLPKKYWKIINRLLVVFGREICNVKPNCKLCFKEVKEICPYFEKLEWIDKTLNKYGFLKISKSNIEKEKGTYILKIRLGQKRKIKDWIFERGYYYYIGSAFGDSVNLKTRVTHHFSKNKKKKWHIDYLLDFGKIESIYISKSKVEHEVAIKLSKKLDYIKDFGSSDCSCVSHLFFLKF